MSLHGLYAYGNYDAETGFYAKSGELSLHPNGLILSTESKNELSIWNKHKSYLQFLDSNEKLTATFRCLYHNEPTVSVEGNMAIWPLYKQKRSFKVLVASHVKYLPITKIEASLSLAGVPNDMIYYVVSGSDKEGIYGNQIHTEKNFWEYGALLAASNIKSYLAPDYWFLIHDTTLPGPKFLDRLVSYDFSTSFDVVSLNEENQFNIGFYKHSFLVENKDYLASMEGMTKRDGISIEVEAKLRKKSKFTSCFQTGEILSNKSLAVWGGAHRLEFYCPQVDLYKYLAYVGGNPKDERGIFATHPETP